MHAISSRVFLILGFFLLGAAPFPAQAGWVEFFFPSLKEDPGPDPSQTLQAPFNYEPPEEIENLSTVKKLDNIHRTDSEIAKWIELALSELTSFTTSNHATDLKDKEKFFDPTGLSDYNTFLSEFRLRDNLNSGQFKIRSFVKDIPVLLNEGALDDRYRWLFETPVMITYVPNNVSDYKNSKEELISQSYNIMIQVGRTSDTDNEHQLIIERWTGKLVESK